LSPHCRIEVMVWRFVRLWVTAHCWAAIRNGNQ
jgi:hypothetical protein